MDDNRAEALIRFIRRYAELTAELPALQSLLDTYAETNAVPTDWREMLAELRKSERYIEILRQVDEVISEIRLSSVDSEVIAQLLKISAGKLPN